MTIKLSTMQGYRNLEGVYVSGTDGSEREAHLAARTGQMVASNLHGSYPIADLEKIPPIHMVMSAYQAAPYVAGLVESFIKGAAGNNFMAAHSRDGTHLTSLFRDRYGVDITTIADDSLGSWGMFGARYDRTLNLDYQIQIAESAQSFWRLVIDSQFGFVNMHCFPSPVPLVGEGNVAFVPGVEEALTKDIQTLVERPDSSVPGLNSAPLQIEQPLQSRQVQPDD